MKKGNDGESRRIKMVPDYSGFDFFLVKQPLQCTLKIPETVMLDRNGAPKDWIFNSSRLSNGTILKKRKDNLLPLSIVKSFCLKYLPSSLLTPIKTISELRDTAKAALQQQKDAEFTSRKKHLQIRTVEGDLLQVSLAEFLDMIVGNKFAEQCFYQKWHMIQQRISTRKHDESYIVQSQRKNHLIDSKCSKRIELAQAESTSYIETIPSTQLVVEPEPKSQDYKFFDSHLNNKFFTAVQQLVECIQKNYKCIVENITTHFVIDYNREPYITEVRQVYVKPSRKLYEIREFAHNAVSGQIKLEIYTKCLLQYLFQNPVRAEPTLDQPLHKFKKHKCRGQFCNAPVLSIPHLPQPRLKLPIIGSNIRRMALSLIEATKKKRARVIERFKEKGILSLDYFPEDSESSEFDDSELEQTQQNVRVCEPCFIFYLNVMKLFEIDAFGGLSEKKVSVSLIEKKKEEILSNTNGNLKKAKEKDVQSVKRSASQATKLRVAHTSRLKPNSVDRSLSTPNIQKTKLTEMYKKIKGNEPKKISLTSGVHSAIEQTANKMIQLKISNVKAVPSSEIVKSQVKSPKKGMDCKPTNFFQASEQLLNKLQFVPRSSRQEFIVFCKNYYKEKLPQKVDRTAFSSEYLPHLYQFMNNSPLVLAPSNLINGKPQMTLKRLSALTGYPEIVSRSAFIFDTLICDEKTTVPFCVISSDMVHSNNQPKRPYSNIFLINDIFDSFIQFIAVAKELLEQTSNCRIILLNYPGQSHTIYDANSPFRPAQFNAIVDKIIFKLAQPGKGCVIGTADRLKFIGFGFGAFLVSCLISATSALRPMIDGVLLANTASNCPTKCRNIFTTLLGLFQAQDKPTANNAFLIYNKAIKSPQMSKEDLQNKGGLNSIRLDGRTYLLKNALKYWEENANQYFADYEGQVTLLYGRSNILIDKTDMQDFLHRRNHERTTIPKRFILQVNGGHDLTVSDYEEFIKNMSKFIG